MNLTFAQTYWDSQCVSVASLAFIDHLSQIYLMSSFVSFPSGIISIKIKMLEKDRDQGQSQGEMGPWRVLPPCYYHSLNELGLLLCNCESVLRTMCDLCLSIWKLNCHMNFLSGGFYSPSGWFCTYSRMVLPRTLIKLFPCYEPWAPGSITLGVGIIPTHHSRLAFSPACLKGALCFVSVSQATF